MDVWEFIDQQIANQLERLLAKGLRVEVIRNPFTGKFEPLPKHSVPRTDDDFRF